MYMLARTVAPPMPAVGEIVFHLKGPSPTMTWCYQQPRALTHITVFPVPFSGISNTPIKVRTYVLVHLIVCSTIMCTVVNLRIVCV